MLFFKNIMFFEFLLIISSFAQTNEGLTIDTTNHVKDYDDPFVINRESFNSDYNKNNYYLLKSLFTNPLHFNNYQQFSGSYSYDKFNNYSQNIIDHNDQITRSKKELYRILAIKYKERNKYDLGEIGKYLGVSKNVAVIILAIISIL